MLLQEFRKPLLLYFHHIYFRNSFCYRIDKPTEVLDMNILVLVGPLVENLTFSTPLALTKFQKILKLVSIFRLPFSKPFWNNLNYVSTSNISRSYEGLPQLDFYSVPMPPSHRVALTRSSL